MQNCNLIGKTPFSIQIRFEKYDKCNNNGKATIFCQHSSAVYPYFTEGVSAMVLISLKGFP